MVSVKEGLENALLALAVYFVGMIGLFALRIYWNGFSAERMAMLVVAAIFAIVTLTVRSHLKAVRAAVLLTTPVHNMGKGDLINLSLQRGLWVVAEVRDATTILVRPSIWIDRLVKIRVRIT
jgi:apolipoprotein N-acyltransferase